MMSRALGCQVPIVAGVMPIVSYTQLARFSDACGAEIPRWIRRGSKALATIGYRFARSVWMW